MATRTEEPRILGALSPSRAGDFLSCPLLFRFRTIDRLPEGTTVDAARGTLVHAVLEQVFDLPAADRTPVRARALIEPAWAVLRRESPEASAAVALVDETEWLASAAASVDRWFAVEDPTRLEPAEREFHVETVLDEGLLLRGIVDRLDVAPDGAMRISDYKTGSAPREGYEARALFQLRLYGLMLWRMRGVVPRQLRLVYLGDSEVVTEEPDEATLLATQRKVLAIWEAIRVARDTGDFEPSPGRQCDWCAHHALCPVFGGVTPPLPVRPPSTGWRARLRRLRRRLRALWKSSAGRPRPPVKSGQHQGAKPREEAGP